jgi:hypothetical protein
VVTILNGTITALNATLRFVAFNPANPGTYAAAPSIAGYSGIPPAIFTQITTSNGAVINTLQKAVSISLAPITGASNTWTLAYFNPNATSPTRGTWVRDASTLCTAAFNCGQTYANSTLTYRVGTVGQFQVVVPISALTTTTGPFNAATTLSASYLVYFALFAFSLLIMA